MPPATSAAVSHAPALQSAGAVPAAVLNMGRGGRVRAAWCPQWQGDDGEQLLALTASGAVRTDGNAPLKPTAGEGRVQLWLVRSSGTHMQLRRFCPCSCVGFARPPARLSFRRCLDCCFCSRPSGDVSEAPQLQLAFELATDLGEVFDLCWHPGAEANVRLRCDTFAGAAGFACVSAGPPSFFPSPLHSLPFSVYGRSVHPNANTTPTTIGGPGWPACNGVQQRRGRMCGGPFSTAVARAPPGENPEGDAERAFLGHGPAACRCGMVSFFLRGSLLPDRRSFNLFVIDRLLHRFATASGTSIFWLRASAMGTWPCGTRHQIGFAVTRRKMLAPRYETHVNRVPLFSLLLLLLLLLLLPLFVGSSRPLLSTTARSR